MAITPDVAGIANVEEPVVDFGAALHQRRAESSQAPCQLSLHLLNTKSA